MVIFGCLFLPHSCTQHGILHVSRLPTYVLIWKCRWAIEKNRWSKMNICSETKENKEIPTNLALEQYNPNKIIANFIHSLLIRWQINMVLYCITHVCLLVNKYPISECRWFILRGHFSVRILINNVLYTEFCCWIILFLDLNHYFLIILFLDWNHYFFPCTLVLCRL